MKITVDKIKQKKMNGEKIAMLTAYDYPMALLMDKAGMDAVLVGDSLANVVLGLESTVQVGMNEMLHHAKAVCRGIQRALVVCDMPFESYQTDSSKAVENARRLLDEAGCNAVKYEWFAQCPNVVRQTVSAGIPVMGHIGLTPQTVEQLGGFKVQGRDAESARRILLQAKELQDAGCFAVVLECVPSQLAEIITQKLSIPTIGIGAGPNCDGQVLVMHDILGLFQRFRPKFAKQYVDLGTIATEAFMQFKEDVEDGVFPESEHCFNMDKEEVRRLKDGI
jgi:3-methyl-2-oxobutanoate hydroxymethyltransferase